MARNGGCSIAVVHSLRRLYIDGFLLYCIALDLGWIYHMDSEWVYVNCFGKSRINGSNLSNCIPDEPSGTKLNSKKQFCIIAFLFVL